jgi:DNA-binding NarL/FixJ family response regulator
VLGVAGTVAEAVELARQRPADVVLMDFKLPDGNGSDAVRQILSESPETKVVMVTASEDEHVLLSAIEAGCAGFLTKSNALDDLEEAVRSVAADEAFIGPWALTRVLATAKKLGRNGARPDLSPREREILELTARAMTNPQIAAELHLSVKTVRNHLQNILWKLESHSKLEAVTVATKRGLITIGE